MRYKTSISVDSLAKIIKVHKTTLLSWLCHYSLSPYVYNDIDNKNKITTMFNLHKRSISTLRKYLTKKNKKYLCYFDTNFKDL